MEGLASVYYNLGLEHILDIKGYDHMLFLLALCIPFTLRDWKKVLILATAFTIGHSVTLVLSTLDLVRFPMDWIEFLIPVTILLTARYDLLRGTSINRNLHYGMALFFGLIHGMGFSNFLRGSMFPGEESNLVWQLLYFNLGIELGQVFVVIVFLIILTLLNRFLRSKEEGASAQKTSKSWLNIEWNYRSILSLAAGVWALLLCIQRIPL